MLDNYNDVLTVDEVCEVLRIGKNTVYKLLQSCQLKSKKIGKNYKIPKLYIIEYLNS